MYPLLIKKIISSRYIIISIFLFSSVLLFAQEEEHCKSSNKKAEKLFNQGVAELKSRNYTDAVKLFKAAIEEDP